jgi:MbtH protein
MQHPRSRRTSPPLQPRSRSRKITAMSTSILDDDTASFAVVVNHEEQYSIWPADREPPLGWRKEGTTGNKAACLEHIKQVWTDMRPLSLRKRMAETAG